MPKKARIEVREELIKEMGPLPAVFLGFICVRKRWTGNVKDLLSMFRTSYHTLRKIRRTLREKGYIRERRTGHPQKLVIEITPRGERKFKV